MVAILSAEAIHSVSVISNINHSKLVLWVTVHKTDSI